jgi:hypothetical protein
MHTPQHNPGGYDNATISNMTALSQNVKFLVMHGYSDDNVHFQNTLQLLDKLDQAGVTNYDVHVFPDSDHSIYFHNANRIVYESKWSNCPPTSYLFANSSCRVERLARERIQRRVAEDGQAGAHAAWRRDPAISPFLHIHISLLRLQMNRIKQHVRIQTHKILSSVF